MRLFTIGFTKKSAERFFTLLRSAGAARVIDTRLNNRSQLAGFTKGDDLPFFLREIASISYEHRLDMAPTQDMLSRYKKHGASWTTYEREFNQLLVDRQVASRVTRAQLADACLLCSENEPNRCHRRLVAEYLAREWDHVDIVHLR